MYVCMLGVDVCLENRFFFFPQRFLRTINLNFITCGYIGYMPSQRVLFNCEFGTTVQAIAFCSLLLNISFYPESVACSLFLNSELDKNKSSV